MGLLDLWSLVFNVCFVCGCGRHGRISVSQHESFRHRYSFLYCQFLQQFFHFHSFTLSLSHFFVFSFLQNPFSIVNRNGCFFYCLSIHYSFCQNESICSIMTKEKSLNGNTNYPFKGLFI